MRKWYLLVFILLLPTMVLRAQDATPSGRIAYIGTDYNVYVEDFEQETTIAVTDDADVEDLYFYEMPTWATDGRLAYFSRHRDDTDLNMVAYVVRDTDGESAVIFEATNRVLNYAYWSPANCDEGENCRDLALLLGGSDTLTVELVRDSDEASSQTIGRGAPFYYSWSPDGTQMFWQRNLERLDVYDVADDEVTSMLDDTPGVFQAPAWSPVDERLLYGALNDETTDLTVFENGETTVLVPELDGVVTFAWSPDGRYIAYTEGYRSLIVIDATTGDVVTETLEDGVFAFFWSPNSESLAYITLASTQNSIGAKAAQQPSGISWSVMTVPDGEQRHFGAFLPTNDMLYLLTYFDQFGQSHQVWSPDSRYLVYSEFTATGDALVRILDTEATNAAPETIGQGVIGIWSFE
jgi:TolB protein